MCVFVLMGLLGPLKLNAAGPRGGLLRSNKLNIIRLPLTSPKLISNVQDRETPAVFCPSCCLLLNLLELFLPEVLLACQMTHLCQK